MRYPSEYNETKHETIVARKILGHTGRMVGFSKSGYSKRNPRNVVIFNANVFSGTGGKIWYGDLDLTLDGDKLRKLSMKLKDVVYVLYEMDGRFENESTSEFHSKATFSIAGKVITAMERMKEYVMQSTHGKLKGQIVYKPEYRR